MTIPPKYQTYLNVLLPSATGTLFYAAVSVLIVTLQALNASTDTGIIQVEHMWFHHVGQWFTRTANQLQQSIGVQHVNSVVVYAFWGGLGILIYLLIRAASKNMGEFVDDINLRDYIWPTRADRNRPLKQFLKRGLFRFVILIVLLIYIAHALGFLLQTGHSVVTDNSSFSPGLMGRYFLLFVEWLVGWHILTILARLFFLRNRLASSE